MIPGGGLLSIMALYGEAPPERGTFFRLQVYERVEISLVELYERVVKSVKKKKLKKPKKANWQMRFMAVKKSTKKRDTKVSTRYVKGVPFVSRGYDGVPFLSKNGI